MGQRLALANMSHLVCLCRRSRKLPLDFFQNRFDRRLAQSRITKLGAHSGI